MIEKMRLSKPYREGVFAKIVFVRQKCCDFSNRFTLQPLFFTLFISHIRYDFLNPKIEIRPHTKFANHSGKNKHKNRILNLGTIDPRHVQNPSTSHSLPQSSEASRAIAITSASVTFPSALISNILI